MRPRASTDTTPPRDRARRLGAIVLALVAAALVAAALASAATAAPYDPHLTRAPYHTDLVGRHVIVNWATDRSATAASASWGAYSGSGCSLTNTQAATRTGITVGTVLEYQWKASLSLPADGSYCYRVLLGPTDLLAANPSSVFQSQAAPGSSAPFSFAVLGDWGQVDVNGNNPDQASLLGQIAASGVRFAMTVGDNGYPSGSQVNYGDLQQHGSNTSAIFGPPFWPVPGASVPIFPSPGNHGLAGTTHADLTNWPQDVAVSASGGRYQNDSYCCVNGSATANYASAWYAFDAGPARFYVLTSAWGDTNTGTGSVYANDAAAHFAPGTPEYQWLLNDLQTHPSGLKFVVSHYPFYSDNKNLPSDTFLQGPTNLEGLLTRYGVSVVFNGHAHIYERNLPSGPGAPVTYVTGGGGGTIMPVDGTCKPYDAYAIGWSPTKLKGTACGAALKPTSATQVFHFLKVTVSGQSVTVAPTDELGRTFDVQTYEFSGAVPDTVIDSAPPALTNSTGATVAFHSSLSPATFTCALDGAAPAACTSPGTYAGLADGPHSDSVTAATAAGPDPSPAVASWTVDTTAPTVPEGLAATAISGSAVGLSWNASSDAGGVGSYDLVRDGSPLTTVTAPTTTFTDTTASPGVTYGYAVRARDAAGNASDLSAPVQVTTPAPTLPVFSDGFESGNLSAWTSSAGLTVQGALIHAGSFAARATTSNGNTYAKKTLPTTYADAYSRVWINLQSTLSQVNVLRHRTAADGSIAYVFITASGALGVRNDVGATTTTSSAVVAPGSGWHEIELHTAINGASSVIEVWLDGARVNALSSTTANLGTTPVGKVQIGEVQSGRTYDVAFDDAAFGTQRVGP
jgi:hypothetical protein